MRFESGHGKCQLPKLSSLLSSVSADIRSQYQRTAHAPQLDQPVIASRDDERQRGMKGDPIHTQQQMMDEAMERYTLYLQSKKDINFLGIIPDKPSPTK